jgi:hypothetical protein
MAERCSGIYNLEGDLMAEANILVVDNPNQPDLAELKNSG